MRKTTDRSSPPWLAALAGLLALVALEAASPAVAVASSSRAKCVFSNPLFAGRCTEVTDVPSDSTPRKACEAILACLNNATCIKTYCEATTIRQGWRLESATTVKEKSDSDQVDGEHEHAHSGLGAETLGRVDFPVSCNPEAQAEFARAVALLHSFWYGEAEKAFVRVTAADPGCAMGHWGVAMSLFHPVWAAANPAAAPTPDEMRRGREAAERARVGNPSSQRERDFIAAVGAFYQPPGVGNYPARAVAFEKSMAEVQDRHPEDPEAAIFHALALLGTAWPTDKTYANQKKAADILQSVLPLAPQHPGVAHYLIHSFDYPDLAEQALPAARAYAKIAASSPHALHMPSHIFTRLALWDESIQSNLASAALSQAHLEKTEPGAASFDQLHALDYLAYAYLQQGRDRDAKRVVDEIGAVDRLDLANFAAAYALAAVPARYVLERHQWSEAGSLSVHPGSFPWTRFSSAEALTHFARALGGARRGDLGLARTELDRLKAIQQSLLEAKDAYWAGQLSIQTQTAEAWIARTEGRNSEALALMRAAADLEDSTEKHPVTPGALLPARELLGDLLMETGAPAQALKEYEASLRPAPGRLNSLAGALRAAEATGNRARAGEFQAQLRALCAKGDGSRAELVALRVP